MLPEGVLCIAIRADFWQPQKKTEKQNILVIREICSWLLPFCKQNLLLFIQPRWQLRRAYVFNHYTVSQKTRHKTLGHNFTNYYPIFKIFSPADSVVGPKFATNSLNIPPRFKHVATLRCEI